MNCDPLAKVYQHLEHLAFTNQLEKPRVEFLAAAQEAKHALLLGDGDGRFLVELAKSNTEVEVDCVELSGKMIAVARQRLRRAAVTDIERIHFHQSDARRRAWKANAYDLVVTHFFLDCFSAEEVEALIPAIRNACRPGTRWLIAEFHSPQTGWKKWHARCWLTAMYCFFRITARLETRQLPDYRKAFARAGFSLVSRKLTMAQLISSELWQLPTPSSSPSKKGPSGSSASLAAHQSREHS